MICKKAQQDTGCHSPDFPGDHFVLVRIPGKHHHFLEMELFLEQGFQAGKLLEPVHIVPEFLEEHSSLISDAHAGEGEVQEARFLEEIYMGAEDPLAEPQLFGQGPAADGLVMADLPEHFVALGQEIHHFRDQFILQVDDSIQADVAHFVPRGTFYVPPCSKKIDLLRLHYSIDKKKRKGYALPFFI